MIESKNNKFLYCIKTEFMQISKFQYNLLEFNEKKNMFEYVNEVCFIEPFAYTYIGKKLQHPLYILLLFFVAIQLLVLKYQQVLNIEDSTIDRFIGFIIGYFTFLMIFSLIFIIKPNTNFTKFYCIDYKIKIEYLFIKEEDFNKLNKKIKEIYYPIDISNVKDQNNPTNDEMFEITSKNIYNLMESRDNVLM